MDERSHIHLPQLLPSQAIDELGIYQYESLRVALAVMSRQDKLKE